MELNGYIVNYKTGQMLPGAKITVTNSSGSSQIRTTTSNVNGYFKIDGGFDNFILITLNGYKPLLVGWETAMDIGTFGLDVETDSAPGVPGMNNSVYLLLLVLVLAIVLSGGKRSKKKVGAANVVTAAAGEAWKDKTTRIVILGIVVVIAIKAFGMLDSLLIAFGLKKNPDTAHLDQQAENPDSFWNPNFYKSGPAGTLLLTVASADKKVQQIYDAIGLFDDDEEAVIAVFKSLRTQSQASFLAERFAVLYNADLLTWLRGSGFWPKDRLSDADVKQITDYVSKLPKYIP